jgi:hypothetical protein
MGNLLVGIEKVDQQMLPPSPVAREFIEGQQHDLFLDPETVQLRLTSFLPGLD